MASATQINAALPELISELRATKLPIIFTVAAPVSWARQQLNVRKTHSYDAAMQGQDFQTIASLPSRVLRLQPSNGRSKQKANVDRNGTPAKRPCRNQQKGLTITFNRQGNVWMPTHSM